ncbi:MAG: hypothetical protein FWG61_02525 [Firmicutes bacterium]|nr:hypothetical protein [Bacillota bacterium]
MSEYLEAPLSLTNIFVVYEGDFTTFAKKKNYFNPMQLYRFISLYRQIQKIEPYLATNR